MRPIERAYLESVASLATVLGSPRTIEEIRTKFGDEAALALEDFRFARKSYYRAIKNALDEMERNNAGVVK